MAERTCDCGARVDASAVFCRLCGQRLSDAVLDSGAVAGFSPTDAPPVAPASAPEEDPSVSPDLRCAACNATWKERHAFCPECGAAARAAEPKMKLVTYMPDGSQQEAVLDGSPVAVGKDPQNEVQLDDRYVSRQHCRFAPRPDGSYEIEDLGSANGTFTRLAEPVVVSPGSTFLVGRCLISVEEG